MSRDRVLRALAGGRARSRRRVCRYVAATSDEPVTLQELSTCVATDGTAAGGDPAAAVDHGSVAVRLHHVDLPALDAAGVLDYDADRRTVQSGPYLEVVFDLLDDDGGDQPRPVDLGWSPPPDGGS